MHSGRVGWLPTGSTIVVVGGKWRRVCALRSRRFDPDRLQYCCGWGQVEKGICTQVASVRSRLAPILLWLGASGERYVHSGRVGWLPTGSTIVVINWGQVQNGIFTQVASVGSRLAPLLLSLTGGKCRTVFSLRSRRLAPDWLQYCCGWGQVQNGMCTQVASVGSRLAPYCCGWGQVENGICTQVASVRSRLAPILLWLGASAEGYVHSGS